MKIVFEPIGIIHSPFREQQGTPIQPGSGKGIEGRVEVFPEFADGLKDLDGFSHIYLLFHFHQSRGYDLRVVPYVDTVLRGVFATRAPRRPNGIGLSVVRLKKIEDRILYVEDMDILDETPLLDIKPYYGELEEGEIPRIGWLEERKKKMGRTRADGRFEG